MPQNWYEAVSATVRALAHEPTLDVGFRGVRLSPDDPRTEIITLAAEDAEHPVRH